MASDEMAMTRIENLSLVICLAIEGACTRSGESFPGLKDAEWAKVIAEIEPHFSATVSTQAGEIARLTADLVRADAKWRDWESAHQSQKEHATYLEAENARVVEERDGMRKIVDDAREYLHLRRSRTEASAAFGQLTFDVAVYDQEYSQKDKPHG